MIGEHVVPGVTTGNWTASATPTSPRCRRPSRPTSITGLPRTICASVNHVVCHGIPERQAPQVRRHRQHRRHGDPRRLPRRHQPDVLRRQATGAGPAPGRVTFEAMWRGIESVRPARGSATSAMRSSRSPRARLPVVREYCGHGIGRVTTRTRRSCTTASRHRHRCCAGHDLHHRAHDQRRASGACACCRTAGPSSPRTTRSPRSGSTPCW